MLKELSLLKWQEKATKLASDDAISRVAQCQENVADLEKNLAAERLFVRWTVFFNKKIHVF